MNSSQLPGWRPVMILVCIVLLASECRPATVELRSNHRDENNLVVTTESSSNSSTFAENPNVSPRVIEQPNQRRVGRKQYPIVCKDVPTLPLFQNPLDFENKSRSEQKCMEYNNIAVVNMTLPFITINRVCTETGPNPKTSIVTHVIGGTVAAPQEFPHVVALGKENEDKKFSLHCGGSLVAPNWVLTAAHCTHGPAGGVRIARLGIQRLSDNGGETVSIKRAIRHPSYKPPAMYADLALLELQRPVTFSKTIMPACLHQGYHIMPTFAEVCGWGVTEFGGNASDTLQEAELELIPNVECAPRHSRSISVPDGVAPSMVCAGAPGTNWRQDTCSGDSGGPLQFMNPPHGHLYQIIGITSFGSGCATVNSPGVYIRVSHYLDWIENIVWQEGN